MLNPRNLYRFSKFSRSSIKTLTMTPSRSVIYFEPDEKLAGLDPDFSKKITDEDSLLPGAEKYLSKTYGVHRDWIIPKVSNSLDLYAKKVREHMLRRQYLPAEIQVNNDLRLRQPGDTIEELKKNSELPIVVLKRDEWSKDLHLVGKKKFIIHLARTDAGYCKQFEFNYGSEEPIRVVLHDININPMQRYPMKASFNRFIPGRPNPIRVPIVPYNENQCHDRMLGANVHHVVNELDLWTYSEIYPPQIHLDLSHLTVKESIKLGDVEKMLPHGVYLHRKYNHRLYQAVIKLEETKLFRGKMAIKKHREQEFLAKKREIELADALKGSRKNEKKPRKKIQNPLHKSKSLE
ncbi:unnamed protein product [Moneuplotes crassus]|nr:unnamed protein product [Moneuplotes crassus]